MAGEDTKKDEPKPFTKAEAAKAVKRSVPVLGEDKKQKRNGNGELVFKPVDVKEEVLDFSKKDDGTVIVVTTDGQKLTGKV